MIWLTMEADRTTHRCKDNSCKLETASVSHIFMCGAGDNDIKQYLKRSI